jgi:hypothetical protein
MSASLPGLGRRLQGDPRNWPLAPRLAAAVPERTSRYYPTGPILNQLATGTCVGHGWRQWYMSALVMGKHTQPDQWAIYREACKRDPWPENDNGDLQAGTSVLAAVQYLHDAGIVSEYRWTRNAEEAGDSILLGHGVLVIGVNWYRGMSSPSMGNVIHATGPLDGGHCIVVSGYNRKTGLFRLTNSWGTTWGDHGRAWLPGEDFQRLLNQDGECCLAVQRVGT